MSKTVNVTQKPDAEEIPAEVLAESIVEIGKAMKKLLGTRLKRETIVLLIHDTSKVGKPDIRAVLDGLESLESQYLKNK